MCSILTAFDLRPGADLTSLRPLALSLSARQRHRGPDWSGVHAEPRALLVHERLAIVDPAGETAGRRARSAAASLQPVDDGVQCGDALGNERRLLGEDVAPLEYCDVPIAAV